MTKVNPPVDRSPSGNFNTRGLQLGDRAGLAILHLDAEEVARRKSVDVEITITAEGDAVTGGALWWLLEVRTFQPDF